MPITDLQPIFPLISLVIWACILLLVDLFIPKGKKGWIAFFAVLGLFLNLAFLLTGKGVTRQVFSGMLVMDGFARYLSMFFAIGGIAGILLAYDYLKRMQIESGEFYVLLLFAISGMSLMASAADMIVVFLALELLSIPLYVLTGYARPKPESEEAAMKYFLLGAFASGFVVYGIALVFGGTGTTSFEGIVSAIRLGNADLNLIIIGAALIFVGLGFKIAVVPFHMWTPDVYHGAPSSVAAFMAVTAKAAGFAALFRVFWVALQTLAWELTLVIWLIAAVTMILGNIIAIAQTNIKRLLAYSSIAHAGYLLMALVPSTQTSLRADSTASGLFFLLAYAFTNFGAWSVVIALEKAEDKGLAIEDYAGLGRKYPALAAAMAVFMLSFTGIPPTLGFLGKFYLFKNVMNAGYIGLALIGVLTSLVSAYYYLRVIVVMYMHEGDPVVRIEPWLNLTTAVAATGTVLLSIFAAPLFSWVSKAMMLLY